MRCKPIFDLHLDLDMVEDGSQHHEFLLSVFSRKLVLVDYRTGPNGYPEVTIRGTKAQLLSWLAEYYENGAEPTEELWLEYGHALTLIA